MMIECEQRTPEWKALRVGKVTASRMSELMAKIQKGEAASRKNYKAEIIAETMTGQPTPEKFLGYEMQWRTETEQFARTAYEMQCDVTVDTCGFAIHPQMERFGASPDGLVGDDGLVEIKCPNTATHLDYILAGAVPIEYQPQMLAEMACTGRQWCDFISFDPRLPQRLQLFVRRFRRDEGRIQEMEEKVEKFLAEVDEVILRLEGAVPVQVDGHGITLLEALTQSLEQVRGPQAVVAVIDEGETDPF